MRPVHALVLASLLTTPALAKNVTVLPFSGKGASNARGQLLDVLCEELDCVPQSKVTKNKKPDWAKARKKKLDLFVAGKVVGKKKKERLELSFMDRPKKTKFKKVYPVRRGKLSKTHLASAKALVFKMVGYTEPIDEEEPKRVAQADRREKERAAEEEAEAERGDEEGEASTESEDEYEEERTAHRSGEVRRRFDEEVTDRDGAVTDALLLVEAGPDMLSRNFSYSQVETPNLRSYAASFIVAPKVHAELFPLASMDNVMSGLGVEANYSMAVGLSSRRSDGPSHPTSMSRLELAAKFRYRPLEGSYAALIPTVGFRNASFAVGAARDGSVLDGLPAVSYSAVLLGLGGELPFSDGKVVVYGRFAYLPVLSAGEILSNKYFPRGSASGLDVRLGLGYRFMRNLEARASGQFSRYGLEFKPESGDAFVAASAVDQYVGGSIAVRYLYDG